MEAYKAWQRFREKNTEMTQKWEVLPKDIPMAIILAIYNATTVKYMPNMYR